MPMSDWAVVSGALPDAPLDALARAGQDFILAVLDFVPELAGVGDSPRRSRELRESSG
jgi:hypothetical protein